MGEYSIVEKADHIMTVRINRPDRLNALHPLANAELGQVFDDFAADDDMQAAIITGEGRGFSAGNDLRNKPKAASAYHPARIRWSDLTLRHDQARYRRGKRRGYGRRF